MDINETTNTNKIILNKIQYHGYLLKFKEDFEVKYVISESDDESYYYKVKEFEDLNLDIYLSGWFHNDEEFIENIHEIFAMDWKLYVNCDEKELDENSKLYRNKLMNLLQPIILFENEYELKEFIDIFLNSSESTKLVAKELNRIIGEHGYKLMCVRIND